MRLLLGILLLLTATRAFNQENGFDFGKVTYAELNMKQYEQDTTSVAVVLNEFGEAYFDLNDLRHIYFQYHVKIKILKEGGKSYANFEVPLRKEGEIQESISQIKASSFNESGNSWSESTLSSKYIFNDKIDENLSVTKFAVPNVRVGSVIEVYYEIKTPYRYNFIPWRFQSDIPKVHSEFWGKYPAYYAYNISLKGYHKLTKNDFLVVKQCIGSSSYGGQGGADCAVIQYSMDNIPAFKEEAYMTARRNFESGITFELRQITHQDGQVDKITNEWKDVEQELKEHEDFGFQIKRAKKIFEEKANSWKSTLSDQMTLVQSVHDYFKSAYVWDGEFGFLTDLGVKKAFENKKGNVAELNLSMLAALQEAGIYAEPVLLATRARGLPIKHYPVLSDFNYVVVRVKVGDKFYFVDATSPLYTVGFLPERCLNGEGRALGDTKAWIDLKPNDKERTVSDFRIKLAESGELSGSAAVSSFGYAGLSKRRDFLDKSSLDEYVKERTQSWTNVNAKNFMVENEREIRKPFIEKFDLTVEQAESNPNVIYFPLFLYQQNAKNPFTSTERFYPVDFGAPTEDVYLLTFEYPSAYELEDLPQNVAVALPNSGGKFLFSVTKFDGKLSVASTLTLHKPVYTSEEYHALREVYARYIATLQSIVVLKKK